MGTEILRPQNCLIQRIRAPPPAFCRRRNSSYDVCNNSNPRSKKSTARSDRPEQRKRFVPARRPSSDDLKAVKNGMMMESVTILRRGQSLGSIATTNEEALKKIADNGSALEIVPKQIRIGGKADVYAGSAFSMSPSPSSLPFPSFSKKKPVSIMNDDSASRDLRRLLRIDA